MTDAMSGCHIGLVGLGTMGANLARNLAAHGASVALHDADPAAAPRLAAELGPCGVAASGPAELVAALADTRVVLLMVPAGPPVDAALAELLPRIGPAGIVIDGGNSHYADTERRVAEAARHGVHFLGVGISGGAEGALRGPSIMAGGDAGALAALTPLFSAIAARAGDEPCFARVGGGGAGHFVKTVHNGIEYAAMQAIAEAYQLMRHILGMSYPEMRAAFAGWAAGDLGSFLMECAVRALDARDPPSGEPLLELIRDTAEQKGTGMWAANAALTYGVPAPSLAEAVHARCLSALKDERVAAQAAIGSIRPAFSGSPAALVESLGGALLAANVAILAQGFALIEAASAAHGWDVDPARVARIWRAGCIVRSGLLEPVAQACSQSPRPANLLRDPALWTRVARGESALRHVVMTGVAQGVPLPVFASALGYVDGYRSGRLWANMTAAQRDIFGRHGFQRDDASGRHHFDW